jgi:hypothetical protein
MAAVAAVAAVAAGSGRTAAMSSVPAGPLAVIVRQASPPCCRWGRLGCPAATFPRSGWPATAAAAAAAFFCPPRDRSGTP